MPILLLVAWFVTLASCGFNPANESPLLEDASKPVIPNTIETSSIKKLEPFGSQDDFDNYIENLRLALAEERQADTNSCPNCESDAVSVPTAAPVSAGPTNDNITNTQEANVDEGGIVKVVGDYLVVLRRGRLFSVAANENDILEHRDTINAFPEEHSTETWYDELIVLGNKIIVVGYSYGYGATELGQFTIDEDGNFSHQGTHFLRSNDYYSSRNYASRLVDNKLIFYMPFYFYNRWSDDNPITLPGQSKLTNSGQIDEWTNIIDQRDIIKPIEDTTNPVLHTIVSCDLSADELVCNAKSVIASYSRVFYVSANAVYLWTSQSTGAHLYRLPLNGNDPGVIAAVGIPTDQFSFKEHDNKSLHVLLRENGNGDAMWAPESRQGACALLSLSLDDFSAEPKIADISSYTLLDEVSGYQMHNRFIGNNVIYGTEEGFDISEKRAWEQAHIYNFINKSSKTLDLGHDVERIEALGTDAVIIGSRQNDLVFSSIALNDEPQLIDSYTLKDKSQGEQRSHGFFYKSLDDHRGILGLPIQKGESSFGGSLLNSSASVFYLSVENNRFSELGALDSSTITNGEDNCLASCIDWYGNSRPIFWRDRIFALLGYDLVEGRIDNNAIVELRRLNFTPSDQEDHRNDKD